MKRVYTIEGLDCANCALKVERGLRKDPNILSATIDFSTKRLYVVYKDKEYPFDEINSKVASFDDDAFLLEPKAIKKEELLNKEMKVLLLRIIISTILFVAALIFEKTMPGKYAIYVPIYFTSLIIVIYDITYTAIQNIVKLRNPFDKNLLLTIAAVGSFCLTFLGVDSFMEGVMVIILSQIGEVFELVAMNKSRNAIIEAVDLRNDVAHLVSGEKVSDVSAESLTVGDVIVVKVGEIVPIDGFLIEGDGTFDVSSLTGEFLPVNAKMNMEILSGYVLTSGLIKIRVAKTFKDSAASKIIDLVTSSGERKAKANRFIDKFAGIYTPIVFFVAVIFATIPPIICKANGINEITNAVGVTRSTWNYFLYTALSFIVIACPCAIVISVPLSFFSGIGLASKHQIIVKGANYFDKLCEVKTFVTDKTGTLTYGSFTLNKQVVAEEIDDIDFLETLMAAECLSNHPISKAIIGDSDISDMVKNISDYHELAGLGIVTKYNGDKVIVGNHKLMQNEGINCPEVDENGTVIYVSKNAKYLGYAVLGDKIKDGSFEFVKKVHSYNNKVVMLTGDSELIARKTSEELNLDRYYFSLMPDEKIKILDEIIAEKNGAVAFIGDGINDAPSIVRSDVGFAMGGIGSDMAIDNADIVIMNDNPKTVFEAIKIAILTRRKALFNIVFALLVKLTLMLLSTLGMLGNFGMLISVLADTGLTVVLIINALLLLYKKI